MNTEQMHLRENMKKMNNNRTDASQRKYKIKNEQQNRYILEKI